MGGTRGLRCQRPQDFVDYLMNLYDKNIRIVNYIIHYTYKTNPALCKNITAIDYLQYINIKMNAHRVCSLASKWRDILQQELQCIDGKIYRVSFKSGRIVNNCKFSNFISTIKTNISLKS